MNNFVVCTIIILQYSAFGITEYNTAINIKNLIEKHETVTLLSGFKIKKLCGI